MRHTIKVADVLELSNIGPKTKTTTDPDPKRNQRTSRTWVDVRTNTCRNQGRLRNWLALAYGDHIVQAVTGMSWKNFRIAQKKKWKISINSSYKSVYAMDLQMERRVILRRKKKLRRRSLRTETRAINDETVAASVKNSHRKQQTWMHPVRSQSLTVHQTWMRSVGVMTGPTRQLCFPLWPKMLYWMEMTQWGRFQQSRCKRYWRTGLYLTCSNSHDRERVHRQCSI